MRNEITVHEFSEQAFVEAVAAASRSSGTVSDQAQYIARYAKRLGAKTFVLESHYMDRHYVDEFALYYSRMFVPPTNAVARVHFFADAFDDTELTRLLEQGMTAPEGSGTLPRYLGYCCVRPIPSVPIGRTVLAQWPDNGALQRQIWATNHHTVHLANLALDVDGLPFQQQDVAVGAYATAALWSALSRVARQDGMRSPTPAEIAEFVGRPSRASVRGPLPPSAGLTVQQLCEITRAFGFAPDVMQADARPEIFAASIHTYLLSGIPVVLSLRGGGRGHAVTAAGFQLSPSSHPILETSVPTRSTRLKKLYVHDDRLGPYARANLEPFPDQGLGEGLTFEIEMADGEVELWLVDAAVAPVYPKVRLTVRGLLVLAEHFADLVERMVGAEDAFDLSVDFRYAKSGDYLAQLRGRIDPCRGASLAREVALSRWCAVIRWYLRDEPFVEFVFDTTDVCRGDASKLVRSIIALQDRFQEDVAEVARGYGVPFA